MTISAETDHYHTLKIAETATQQEIKQSYRRLAKALHPDTTQNTETDAESIKQLNAAYEVLGDPQLRSH